MATYNDIVSVNFLNFLLSFYDRLSLLINVQGKNYHFSGERYNYQIFVNREELVLVRSGYQVIINAETDVTYAASVVSDLKLHLLELENKLNALNRLFS